MRTRLRNRLGWLLAVALLGACASPQPDDSLVVFATTGHLADAVANIAPDAHVITMVGPGGDPHSHQPSTRDIQRMLEADVVVWHGLNLEAHMTDQLRSLGPRQVAAAEAVPTELLLDWPGTDADGNQLRDPHVWNSPEAWGIVVDAVAGKLAEVHPGDADQYLANAARYREEVDAMAAEATKLLAGVPEPRMLVTGHDAFDYLGHVHDLEVHSTDLISSEAALSARELSELATLVAENQVPVVFRDHQVNPQAIVSLQESVSALGWDVSVAEADLHADSLGATAGVDTYIGAFTHNVRTIAEELGATG